jgi:sterol desaturase/sphingolipid hydroxylase (fatty acid hydroxylase superfamily)
MGQIEDLKGLPVPLGYLFSLLQIAFYGTFCLPVYYYGVNGMIFVYFMEVFIAIIDATTSERTWYNVKALKSHGYQNWQLVGSAINHSVSWWATGALATYYFAHQQVEARYTLEVVIKSLLLLIPSEFAFTFVHRYLHRNYPQLHFMHHCCTASSFTTNLFFHPLDLILEFGAPVGKHKFSF